MQTDAKHHLLAFAFHLSVFSPSLIIFSSCAQYSLTFSLLYAHYFLFHTIIMPPSFAHCLSFANSLFCFRLGQRKMDSVSPIARVIFPLVAHLQDLFTPLSTQLLVSQIVGSSQTLQILEELLYGHIIEITLLVVS